VAAAGAAARLVRFGGSVEEVEGELQRLDREMLDGLRATVDGETLARLEAEVRDGLGSLAPRLGAASKKQTVEILLRRRLRQETGLPVLSLFSPEAAKPS
jgi:hypothetical protein